MPFQLCVEGCALYDQSESEELDDFLSQTNKEGCNVQWILALCGILLKLLCLGCIVRHEQDLTFWVFFGIYLFSEIIHFTGIFLPIFTTSSKMFPTTSYRLGWFANVWFGICFAAPYFFLFGFVAPPA
ncbi:hypothetical protein M758_7G164500 [Ceratodon purpureus]|uniref:Uncharacterized protein n=1 Tax=Ceratodon purpureus TaxID=3225 RepID=A0A8T0HAE5_CERPU|nr:hypothetical protein KC19_7G115700 [Ceratodon purpureus]KAG0611789.1 hypothetical protein M758_7G164500 [Ceratodon purpureus]